MKLLVFLGMLALVGAAPFDALRELKDLLELVEKDEELVARQQDSGMHIILCRFKLFLFFMFL